MAIIEEGARFAAWLKTRAYDAVFHLGDTGLQFMADLIRGADNPRRSSYDARQTKRQERKSPPTMKASTQKASRIQIRHQQGTMQPKERMTKPKTRKRKRRR